MISFSIRNFNIMMLEEQLESQSFPEQGRGIFDKARVTVSGGDPEIYIRPAT
jgi:hypothetical protein